MSKLVTVATLRLLGVGAISRVVAFLATVEAHATTAAAFLSLGAILSKVASSAAFATFDVISGFAGFGAV
ncbi:hypothetical protein F4811DRAFT_508994 [Daldinia bambusicola]|nr:hypothetical protein F4811DRAFT_508994 [Daldinia bambusicola]